MKNEIKQNMTEPNKKIAFINTSLSWGGLEMNIVKLATWLQDAGENITIFCVEGSPIAKAVGVSNIPIVCINKHRKYFDLIKAKILSNLLVNKQINVIFIFDNRNLSTAVIAKILSNKHLEFSKIKLVFQQQMQIAGSKKDIFHRWHHAFIDKWISPLEILKKQVLHFTTIPEAKIEVIPLCVDIGNLREKNISKTAARVKLNISPEVLLIGIVGRIDRLKGQHFLIEAIYNLRKIGYNVELLVAGEPTREKEGEIYNNYILQLVKHLELEKHVHFYSFFDDVGLLYSAMDIFALATQSETFGMVTIEAMSFGKPIIATNSGGTPEILANGEFGLLYESGNLEDFLEKVKILLENEVLREKIAAAAKAEAIKKYSHSAEVKKILSLISRI